MIELSEEDASRLRSSIHHLMDHYHPNRDGADYRCEFCEQSPTHEWFPGSALYKETPTIHLDDCDGVRFLKMLDR